MSTVLDRTALEASPLADLHLIANEIGVDGFRRLRKADLVDAILTRQSGDGTDVSIRHEGIPDAIPAADNEAGTRMALTNLAHLVAAEQ